MNTARPGCKTCGADWGSDTFNGGCAACGSGGMEIACPLCGGRCDARWQRSVVQSLSSGIAHWMGDCQLSRASSVQADNPPQVSLRFRQADGGTAVQRLKRPRILIGRNRSADLFLPLKTVGSRHAELRWHAGGLWLCSLEATWPVRMNGFLVDPRDVRGVPVRSGQRIRLGQASVEIFIAPDGLELVSSPAQRGAVLHDLRRQRLRLIRPWVLVLVYLLALLPALEHPIMAVTTVGLVSLVVAALSWGARRIQGLLAVFEQGVLVRQGGEIFVPWEEIISVNPQPYITGSRGYLLVTDGPAGLVNCPFAGQLLELEKRVAAHRRR